MTTPAHGKKNLFRLPESSFFDSIKKHHNEAPHEKNADRQNDVQYILFRKLTLGLMVGLWMVILSLNVSALEYENGEFSVDMDTTLSYSAAIRATGQDSDLLANVNADDGNRNFDEGDFITNRFMVTMDLGAKYKDVGLFVRPRFFYDFAYDGSNANDSSITNNNLDSYGGELSSTDDFPNETQDVHRDDVEILDAFVFGRHNAGDNLYEVRVGQQVVSWGESIYLANGISSAQAPVDVTQAFAPGVELRDLYLPTGQVMARASFGSNYSVVGYYQWEWEKTRLSEAGSFFSTMDFLDKAGERLLLGDLLGLGVMNTLDRIPDQEADDSGQWGIAFRYLADWLNATEFGFYFINYHDKAPMLKSEYDTTYASLPSFGTYWLEYAEDIKLYGFSLGTVLGDTNVGVDMTYRQDVPMAILDMTKPLTLDYVNGDYCQMQASFSDVVVGNKLWDQLAILGEVGVGWVEDLDGADKSDLIGDDISWGGTVNLTPSWFNVFSGIDFELPVIYTFNPDGTSPLGTFTEKSDKFGIDLKVTYLQNLTASIGYVNYLNSSTYNLTADRDYFSFNVKYTF